MKNGEPNVLSLLQLELVTEQGGNKKTKWNIEPFSLLTKKKSFGYKSFGKMDCLTVSYLSPATVLYDTWQQLHLCFCLMYGRE